MIAQPTVRLAFCPRESRVGFVLGHAVDCGQQVVRLRRRVGISDMKGATGKSCRDTAIGAALARCVAKPAVSPASPPPMIARSQGVSIDVMTSPLFVDPEPLQGVLVKCYAEAWSLGDRDFTIFGTHRILDDILCKGPADADGDAGHQRAAHLRHGRGGHAGRGVIADAHVARRCHKRRM